MRQQLFLDCDGVLADFDRAFADIFGCPPRDREDRLGSKVFWRDLQAVPDFYRNLPLMPGARELYDFARPYRPIILTGCPLGGWAEPQKLAWAAEHFPGVPTVLCTARDKRIYCLPGDVLVDDRTQHMGRWVEAGGTFVHHRSAEETIRALTELL